LQNKANFKMGNIAISAATSKAYVNEQRTMNKEPYPKQTQSKPISNAVQWCEKSHPIGVAGREIATHSTALRGGFLAMTAGRNKTVYDWGFAVYNWRADVERLSVNG